MFVDARAIPPGQIVTADICVVGAGAAGLALARVLAGRGLAPVVLEAGGLGRDADGQALFRGECVGLPYELDTTRTRRLGGSTNCWGGFCAPFPAHHFAPRPWLPHSGWPISRATLDPYYRRAAELCGLDPDGFDPAAAAGRHPRLREGLFPLDGRGLERALTQVVRARRHFGDVFRAELRSSATIRVFLYATAAALLPEADGRSIASVRVASEPGRGFTVRSRVVVLAAGAIETARLLLLSTGVHPAGIGNDHGVVGRYFMEHPRVRLARVRLLERPARAKLYDSGYAVHRLPYCLHLHLPYATQAREGVGAASAFIEAPVRGEDGPGVTALKGLCADLRWGRRPAHPVRRLGTIARDGWNVGALACWYAFGPEAAVAARHLTAIVEPCPNPDSRVTLGDGLDRLGMRRVRLDWRLTELDRRTVRRTTRLMCERLQGVAGIRVEPLAGALDGSCLMRPAWTWHHMGTARMGDDPRRSVVDADCRVHGVGNLYVAGSAVFPTAGNHSPTFTLLALSLRLADHLAAVLRRGAAPPTEVGAGAPAEAA